MAAASMLINVTHIDDSVRGRQGPCVNFWGVTHDRSLYLTMELYLESIRQNLESKIPPRNVCDLDTKKIFCVLVNHRWHRAKIPELKLSQSGMVEVCCIDSGKTHTVPLIYLRTLDFPGYEADNIRDCPPLASKFLLADVVAPLGLGTHARQWSDLAMMYMKINVENGMWKAIPMAMYGAHQGVRLYNSSNELLASALIQQGLGVAAVSYNEAVVMSEEMDKQPSFMKPAFYSSPTMKVYPAGCDMVYGQRGNLRSSFSIPPSIKDVPGTRSYVINNLPHNGRYDVAVLHIAEGPSQFFVQIKSEISIIENIRKKLDCITPKPFQGKPLGSPCIVASPVDKRFHRGLITGMKDFGSPSCSYTVYFIDIGSQIPVSLNSIYDIPQDLLTPYICAYRVSLFGAEKLSKSSAVNDIFSSLVKSASNLQAEVADIEKQEITLYDDAGRSICDILGNFYADRSVTPLSLPTNAVTISVVEMPSLNLAGEESVFVSDAGEPGYFFGQLEEIRPPNLSASYGLKDLNELVIELNHAYSAEKDPPLLYSAQESWLGNHGVVKWEEDDVYYRARVIKEITNVVEVVFIDYGNTISVPRNKVLSPLKCLTRFCQPPYGIFCKFEEVTDMTSGKWKHLIMDRWIKVKIGTCTEGVYSVTFANDPCNNRIIKKIKNEISKTASLEIADNESVKTDHPVPTPLVQSPVSVTDDRRIRSTQNGNFSVTIKNVSCRSPKDDVNAMESNSLEEKSKTSQSNIMEHSESESTSQPVYVQVTTRSPVDRKKSQEKESFMPEAANSIIESENQEPDMVKTDLATPATKHPKFYPDQPEVLKEGQGEVVCVRDPSSFYIQPMESYAILAEIGQKMNEFYSDGSKLAINGPKPGSACVVQYTEDRGWYRGKIVEMCDPADAMVLFVDYGNMQRGPVDQLKNIDEDFVEVPPLAYHCKLDDVDASRNWTVEDKKKFERRTVGKLVSVTYKKKDVDGKYPVQLVGEKKGKTFVINEDFGGLKIPLPSSGYSCIKVSDKPIGVIVTCYADPLRFFLSPSEGLYQNQLEELEKFYSKLSSDELLEDQPSLGLPCVTRYTEDGLYYRSQILSIRDGMADILFVDFGNQQETPLSQLKRITPIFMEFPQLTWCCKLKGVKMLSPITPELKKHIIACFASNEELSALFYPNTSDENNQVFEVDLTIPIIGDASQYLIGQKILERDLLQVDVELAAQNVNFASGEMISTNAIVSCFKSPTDFWIQLDPKAVDDIMKRLDKLAIDPEFINKKGYVPFIGKPCLAFYEVDKRWYRATVEALEDSSATICYVDYGNSCNIKTCDMRGLPQEFAELPALAFKCYQNGADKLSEAALREFEDILMDLTDISVQFLNSAYGILCVRLFQENNDVAELCGLVHPQTVQKECVVEGNVGITSKDQCINVAINNASQNLLPAKLDISMAVNENLKVNHVEVIPVYALSPNQFWVHMVDDHDQLLKMQQEISVEYDQNSASLKLLAQPSVGQIYGVLHPMYKVWYRARVMKICNDNSAVVHFVDYGDSDTVPIANIYVLVQLFVDIPYFAIECALKEQSIDWSDDAFAKFITDCIEKNCRVVFGKEENGVRFVDSLLVGENNKNVFDLLAGL